MNFFPKLSQVINQKLVSVEFYSEAEISFVGKGCVDKAQELMNGQSIHSKDGWNIALTKVFPPLPKSLRKPTGFLNPCT